MTCRTPFDPLKVVNGLSSGKLRPPSGECDGPGKGLPVTNGEEIVLADTPESFADAVTKLLQNQPLADEIGQRAAARVRKDFGWESVSDSFAAICDRARKTQIGELIVSEN